MDLGTFQDGEMLGDGGNSGRLAGGGAKEVVGLRVGDAARPERSRGG